MENMRNLTPENDTQELWELKGRVKALLALVEMDFYITNEEIIAMLCGAAGKEVAGDGDATGAETAL